MEVKINREIRNYTESMFFRTNASTVSSFLSWRAQFAVGVYFLLKTVLLVRKPCRGCAFLAAAPFAALGFIKYNGMTAEKFVWAWIKM